MVAAGRRGQIAAGVGLHEQSWFVLVEESVADQACGRADCDCSALIDDCTRNPTAWQGEAMSEGWMRRWRFVQHRWRL